MRRFNDSILFYYVLGSRIDKHWFLIRDTQVKTERLLTLVPSSDNSPIKLNSAIREVLSELFIALQHPYIHPVLKCDFTSVDNTDYIITILPYNSKGSLKDLIYRVS